MKLLLDQGLPRSAVAELSARGIVAEHMGDLGLAAATDEAILDEARLRDAVVVTLEPTFTRCLLTRVQRNRPLFESALKRSRPSNLPSLWNKSWPLQGMIWQPVLWFPSQFPILFGFGGCRYASA